MSTAYTRSSPSTRYQQLIEQYKLMHTEGERFRNIPPEQTFSGQSLPRHAEMIKSLVDRYQTKTLLDYGCGKGAQYTAVRVKLADGTEYETIPAYWGVEKIVCYDPGYEPFSHLPSAICDGVICTDVLEHCPEEDIPWILDELFGFARKFVLANVACYPAMKRLANGENAHCTIKDRGWWHDQIHRAADVCPHVRYFFLLDQPVTGADGRPELMTMTVSG